MVARSAHARTIAKVSGKVPKRGTIRPIAASATWAVNASASAGAATNSAARNSVAGTDVARAAKLPATSEAVGIESNEPRKCR